MMKASLKFLVQCMRMRSTIWTEDTPPLAMHMGWLLTESLNKLRFFAFGPLGFWRFWRCAHALHFTFRSVLSSNVFTAFYASIYMCVTAPS